MKTATIADVSQEEFDEAVQTVISGIKSSDPRLDTRLGTALRSLLVNPEARIEATTTKQIDYVRKATSLKALKESEEAGEDVDADDVNAIMSNFNIKSSTGTRADGVVKISVDDGTKVYAVAEGTEFRTIDDLVFTATSNVIAAAPGTETGSNKATTKLYEGAASFFFLVPVEAADVGAVYNIQQGISLTTNTSIYTFISAEAYKSFCGGSDVTNIQDAIDRIPAGLSIRGFVNKTACEGMLRDKFDDGRFPIIDCSAVGYGNSAQRRDKHNIFGVGVGGRVDLYVRNFGDLNTITEIIKGVRVPGTNDYILEVTPDKFPGSYWVKEVGSTKYLNSSLEFSCKRKAYNVNDTWHDFDIHKDTSEIFNTVWQGLTVTVHEVPGVSSGSDQEEWPDTLDFSVAVYCLPQATELQNYVDSDAVRNVATDVVVRCPIICTLEVSATVVYDVDNPMDVEYAKYKIKKYINNSGFVGSLTRSEIVHILKECGAVSVDLSNKDMLYGTLYDAKGKEYKLSGDALKLYDLADDSAMLSQHTAIFAVEPENIQLTLTPNK